MKRFLIWFFVILLAATAAAGWYAYDNGVRTWDELVVFAQNEWNRLTGLVPEVIGKPGSEATPTQPTTPVVKHAPKDTTVLEAHDVGEPEETTNRFSIFSAAEGEEFNPLLLGHWTCVERPTWHRIYTDEYSGNGYYWGKEWDEADVKLQQCRVAKVSISEMWPSRTSPVLPSFCLFFFFFSFRYLSIWLGQVLVAACKLLVVACGT